MAARLSVLLVVVCLLVPSSLARADNPRLVATVGTNDAFVISLRDASGALVAHLDPGTYDIAVSDRSSEHNFHLTGPGVNKRTGIVFRGRVVWKLTLEPGVYTYRSDVHKKLRGVLTVTATG